jgi:hypothetical protein
MYEFMMNALWWVGLVVMVMLALTGIDMFYAWAGGGAK